MKLVKKVWTSIVSDDGHLEILPLVELLLNVVDLALDYVPCVRAQREANRRVCLP